MSRTDSSKAEVLHPEGWPRPKGYAYGVVATGRVVSVSGTVGWDAAHRFISDDFVAQVRQALQNIVAILAEAGARPEHLVRLTWYVIDREEYLAASRPLGAVYREIIGSHYPAMSVVQVSGLVESRARVEIEATAVVPDGGR